MTPVDLEELAERVERGSCEDRALDGDVWHALYPEGEWHRFDDMWCRRDPDDGVAWDLPFRFTASLDAVTALVEEKLPGWAYAAINEKLRGPIGYVHNNEPSFVGVAAHPNPAKVWIERRAPTPARALLAAALRAMKEEGR